MVHIYTTVLIGYMINPSLKFNNLFITQVEKCLGCSFSISKMKTIKNCLIKKNTSIMALIFIYENNEDIPNKNHRVLSCVVYNLIGNYVCIEYLSCQSKTLINISCYPTFKDTGFNTLLGIGITELLLNLIYWHGFMKKANSNVILNFQTHLINNYLS